MLCQGTKPNGLLNATNGWCWGLLTFNPTLQNLINSVIYVNYSLTYAVIFDKLKKTC